MNASTTANQEELACYIEAANERVKNAGDSRYEYSYIIRLSGVNREFFNSCSGEDNFDEPDAMSAITAARKCVVEHEAERFDKAEWDETEFVPNSYEISIVEGVEDAEGEYVWTDEDITLAFNPASA